MVHPIAVVAILMANIVIVVNTFIVANGDHCNGWVQDLKILMDVAQFHVNGAVATMALFTIVSKMVKVSTFCDSVYDDDIVRNGDGTDKGDSGYDGERVDIIHLVLTIAIVLSLPSMYPLWQLSHLS